MKNTRYLIIFLIILGMVMIAFFGIRFVRSTVRIHKAGIHPDMTDIGAIRGWMTIPYISQLYHVPEDPLWQAAGVPPEGNRGRSLGELNRQYVKEGDIPIVERIRQAVLTFQERPKRMEPVLPGVQSD